VEDETVTPGDDRRCKAALTKAIGGNPEPCMIRKKIHINPVENCGIIAKVK
jgi:hypothetical protein